ncbi:putative signal transducing protein [Chitinophaga caseinilytica]|uniref:DUF2007 domain-containing protein n=1 Tax=Chitinophaga caseinilytica TaxID=2267521 RepID=A0ABZ2Z892_9BACT
MEKDWVKVYASNIAYESEIIRGMLDENGIEAVIVPRQDSSFVTMLPGMDEVYVHVSNEAQAKQLIAESRPEPGKTE